MNGPAQPALKGNAPQRAQDDAWKSKVRQFVKEGPRKLKSQLFSEVFHATNYRLPATEACPDELKERVQQRTLAAIHHSNMQAFLEARRCMQFTRSKSRRLPNTELQYIDLDTNTQISAGEYERRYILYLNYTALQQQQRRVKQQEQLQQELQKAKAQRQPTAPAMAAVAGKRSREEGEESEQKVRTTPTPAAATEEQSESTTSDTDVSEDEPEEVANSQKRIRLVDVSPLQRH